MKINLVTEGLLNPARLSAWSSDMQKEIHAAVARGMKTGGTAIAKEAKAKMASNFAVKRAGFSRSLTAKVYDNDPTRLPAVRIGSKIPWLGIHVRGGSIGGNLLIPLLPNRIGPKRFRAVITALMRSGNAYFIQRNGKTILMAENISENGTPLARFKRAERARTGQKRLKRGQDIPVALLVKRVSLKPRFDLPGIVQAGLPRLANALQIELDKL